MSQKRPLISVIIPTYNRAHLVGRAIQSVLNQTFQDFEIIVVDDGSTDNTEEVVRAFNDPRIHYIRHKGNYGASAARNTGIRVAKGEYVAFLDSDDEWSPTKLELQVRAFRALDDSYALVFGCIEHVDEEGVPIAIGKLPMSHSLFHQLLRRNVLGSCSGAMIRKSVLSEVGGFDERLPARQDLDLWLRISATYNIYILPDILTIQYHHGTQISKDICKKIHAHHLFLAKYKHFLEKNKKAYAYQLYSLGRLYLSAGNLPAAREHFIKSLLLYPRLATALFLIITFIPHVYNLLKKIKITWRSRKKHLYTASLRHKHRPLRICFVAPRFHTNQYHSTRALINNGHKVVFFTLRQGRIEEYSTLIPTVLGCSTVFNVISGLCRKHNNYRFFLKWAWPPLGKFWRELQQFHPDLVIVRDPNTIYGFLACVFAKIHGAKVIFYTQGPKYRNTSKISLLLRDMFAALFRADWITPVLGKIGPESRTIRRMHYVPFVIEPGTPPKEKVWFREGFINIMTVGKFEHRKNHILLLRAIKELSHEFPVRLTIVGECSTKEHENELQRVKAYVKDNQLDQIVMIKTNLPYQEVQALYALHDLFVLPSRDEPIGVSVLEAMAQGLPVICSDTNGAQFYIEPDGNGYIFHTDDLADLCENLRKLLSDRARMIEMGRYSYQLVLERHNPSRYVDAIERIANLKKGGSR